MVAGALRRGAAHAVDGQLLGRRLVGRRIGFAHLGQRLLGLAGLQQLAGLLQRLGDFGPQRLRRGQRAQRGEEQRRGPGAQSCRHKELLVADDADLGHAQTLRRGQDHRHHLVGHQLVRPQVHLGLVGHGRHRGQLGFELVAVGDDLPVPADGAVEVDVDAHDLRRRRRLRARAHRHVHLDRMRLDRDGDDEHDQQHQHDVDQRCHVHLGQRLVVAAGTQVHGHVCPLSARQPRRPAAR